MKRFFLMTFAILMGSSVSAQDSLFDIWQAAFKHVDIYNYSEKDKMSVEYDSSWIGFWEPQFLRHKKIAEDIMSQGFEFNPRNDTILLVCDYLGYSDTPISIYIQSTSSQKAYDTEYIDGILTLVEIPVSDVINKWDRGIYDLWYSGNAEKFRRFYEEFGGDTTGGDSYVWRIVLKDGAIVNPSILWIYNYTSSYEFLTEQEQQRFVKLLAD